MGRRGFISTVNRISREMERSAKASQRDYERGLREQARQVRAYQRQLVADEKENKRLYVESQMEDAQSQNQEIEEQVAALGRILADGLSRSSVLDFAKLRVTPSPIQVDLLGLPDTGQQPNWKSYAPDKPLWLLGALPWVKNAHEQRGWSESCSRRVCKYRETRRLPSRPCLSFPPVFDKA